MTDISPDQPMLEAMKGPTHLATSHENNTTDRGVHSSVSAPGSSSITQVNQLSTWALVSVLLALFVASVMGAAAIGIAMGAQYAAQMAERNTKLMQYQLEEAVRKWEEERKR